MFLCVLEIIQMMENYSSNRQCGNDVMCEEAQPYINQINAVSLYKYKEDL